jgi:hypothetical protein
MRLSGTTFRAPPERLALLQQPDAWPLPPPSWRILTDEQWAEVRHAMARNIAPGNEMIYPT